jgi:hypothetical protein
MGTKKTKSNIPGKEFYGEGPNPGEFFSRNVGFGFFCSHRLINY